MGTSLWDAVLLLLIGVAIAIVVGSLRFVSVRLWNCLMKWVKTPTAVGRSAHAQPLPDSGAAANANGVPDLETGNGNGPAQDRNISDPEVHTPVIKSPGTST